MNESVALTIFTPTYNRASLLPRLFDSIKHQSGFEGLVEWLVVDDGSTDDTAAILATFAAERPDLLVCLRVENGGKHRAINLSATIARGRWILMVDSDDIVAEGALQQLFERIAEVEGCPEIGMIRALRKFPDMAAQPRFHLPLNPASYSLWISTERAFDCVEVVRRSVLLLYPFPNHADEFFMAEGWLWHSIDETHQTVFVNEEWVQCFYQHDGLSARSRQNRATSPLSAMDVYRSVLIARVSWRVRARASINWWRYRLHAHKRNVRVVPSISAHWIFAPFGWLLFRWDRMQLAS